MKSLNPRAARGNRRRTDDNSPPLCGDPSGDDSISAADALTVLRTAVGTAECQDCVCDTNSSGSVQTSDALLVLRAAVGQSIVLSCPPCVYCFK